MWDFFMQKNSIGIIGADRFIILFFAGVVAGSIIVNIIPFSWVAGDECLECGLYRQFHFKKGKLFGDVPLPYENQRNDNARTFSCHAHAVYQKIIIHSSSIYRSCVGDGQLDNHDGTWYKWHKDLLLPAFSALYILYAGAYYDDL